jgi:hypothetical protein
MKIYGPLNKSCQLYWNGGKFDADKKIDGELSELGTASQLLAFGRAQKIAKRISPHRK